MPRKKPAARSGQRKGGTRRRFGRIRTLRSGRYQASYTGPDLEDHYAPTTFETKGDAAEWLDREERLIDRDEWTAPKLRHQTKYAKGVTVAEYGRAWLKHRTLKPTTRRDYASLLENRIIPELGTVSVKALTVDAVEAWHDRQKLRKTPTATAHAYALLRTIMTSAVDDDIITVNPCRIRGAGTSRRVHRVEPATVEELALIVEHMPEPHRLAVMSRHVGLVRVM